MSGRPYLASQDSALLRRALSAHYGKSFLEIGCGNAGALVEASRRSRLAVGTDLVKPSAEDWKGSASVVLADGASCFRPRSFDVVAFNPPYLPSDSISDPAVDGGADGLDVPLHFLREGARVLAEGGRMLVLLSSQNRMDRMMAECDLLGLDMSLAAEAALFGETLAVYELGRR